jgi:hypothetical protein
MACKEAQTFLSWNPQGEHLPPELVPTLRRMAGPSANPVDRLDLFTLLRAFPSIEEQWHAGKTPRSIAVPAMARLARIIRHLCVMEQEAGDPFIELLQDTLGKCSDYQSAYLTGCGGGGTEQERGDWLLGEVSRLMENAEALARDERPIEAAAAAALAEWRARSLEFAAKAAPLSSREPIITPRISPAPQPSETKQAEEPAAKFKEAKPKEKETKSKTRKGRKK